MVLGIPEYRLARGLIGREIERRSSSSAIDARAAFRVGADATLEELLGRARRRCSSRSVPGGVATWTSPATSSTACCARWSSSSTSTRASASTSASGWSWSAAATSRSTRPAPRCAAAGDAGERQPDAAPLAGRPEDARRGMTTTLDVARAAIRAGVLDVTVVALESPEEIPADPEEIAEAEDEGIAIVYRKGPHRFVGRRARRPGWRRSTCESVFDDERPVQPDLRPRHRGGPARRHGDPRRRPGRRPRLARRESSWS